MTANDVAQVLGISRSRVYRLNLQRVQRADGQWAYNEIEVRLLHEARHQRKELAKGHIKVPCIDGRSTPYKMRLFYDGEEKRRCGVKGCPAAALVWASWLTSSRVKWRHWRAMCWKHGLRFAIRHGLAHHVRRLRRRAGLYQQVAEG